MTKRTFPLLALLAFALLIWLPATASAQDLGEQRVQDMNGRWYQGQVEEVSDGYRIKMSNGITVKLRKGEVKTMIPVEEGRSEESSPGTPEAAENSFRRYVADDEIEELLTDITIDESDITDAGGDAFAELPVDEFSLEEMKRLAGPEAQVLTTDHVLLVYTAKDDEARRLCARLERVWDWNMRYMKMLDVPMTVPDHKLEVYFFGSQKEFDAYQTNIGGNPTHNVLGFFRPDNNRSAFFDLHDWAYLEGARRAIENKNTPYKERQRLRNLVRRWVEYQNMQVVQHETGHHIHFNINLFPADVFMNSESQASLPVWLVEGTTMMFEVPPTRSGASLGAINQGRLHEFRKYYMHHQFSPDWVKAFILENGVWYAGGGSSYPLGWAMVYYLFKEHRPEFAKYVRIIAAREPGVEISYTQREREFEDCFGRIDEEWVSNWYEFLRNLPYKPSETPPELFP
ncbi:MAG: DUF1570 domain-containing protein [Phycisphaerae bacterium]|jgi:hypothetical protein